MNDTSSDQPSPPRYDPYGYTQEPPDSNRGPAMSSAPYEPPQAGWGQPAEPGPANGMGTAALVLGISGLVTSWIPLVGFLGWVACVLAIVFGAIGIARAGSGRATNKGAATAGLVLGIVGMVVGVVLSFALWTVSETSGPSTVEVSSAEHALRGGEA